MKKSKPDKIYYYLQGPGEYLSVNGEILLGIPFADLCYEGLADRREEICHQYKKVNSRRNLA